MESYKQNNAMNRNSQYHKIYDVLTGVLFGTVILLGVVFLVRLLFF